jgi:hypothetical protein
MKVFRGPLGRNPFPQRCASQRYRPCQSPVSPATPLLQRRLWGLGHLGAFCIVWILHSKTYWVAGKGSRCALECHNGTSGAVSQKFLALGEAFTRPTAGDVNPWRWMLLASPAALIPARTGRMINRDTHLRKQTVLLHTRCLTKVCQTCSVSLRHLAERLDSSPKFVGSWRHS